MEKNKIRIMALNGFISVKDSERTFEPDVMHSEMIVKEELLDQKKSLCRRANFLATDRMDLQLGAKEC